MKTVLTLDLTRAWQSSTCKHTELMDQDDPQYAAIYHYKCVGCGMGFHKCAVETAEGKLRLVKFATGKSRRARRTPGF